MSNSTRPSTTTTTTTTAGSGYDERFVVPLEASRRGAHRARVSPLMAALPVLAVVGIVVGAIALVYVFLGGMGGADTGTQATTNLPAASNTPAASGSASISADSVAGNQPPPSDSPTAAAAAPVDKNVQVAVYNGTSPTVSGLAKKAAGKLTANGWTLGVIATWTGAPVTTTTVFYGSQAQQATAAAVVKSLGHGITKLSAAKAGGGLVVVVSNDYPGAGGTAARPTGNIAHSSIASRKSPVQNAAAKPSAASSTGSGAAKPPAASSTGGGAANGGTGTVVPSPTN